MRIRYLLMAAAVVASVACGGSPSTATQATPTPAPTPQSVTVSETEFAFNPSTLNLKAGDYVFQVQDAGKAPHDLHIVDSTNQAVAGTTAVLQGGQASTFTATLKAGTYTMFCAVDGHRTRGMQGTITVS